MRAGVMKRQGLVERVLWQCPDKSEYVGLTPDLITVG